MISMHHVGYVLLGVLIASATVHHVGQSIETWQHLTAKTVKVTDGACYSGAIPRPSYRGEG